MQTMFPAIFRFFSFGYPISRYTCASVSNPLIESSACPNAIRIPTEAIFGQKVPFSQPSASLLNVRFSIVGGGGNVTLPRTSIVIGHQIRKATTITVVICIIRSALLLDSWMPLTLLHQKYTVTSRPKNTENMFGPMV